MRTEMEKEKIRSDEKHKMQSLKFYCQEIAFPCGFHFKVWKTPFEKINNMNIHFVNAFSPLTFNSGYFAPLISSIFSFPS